MCEWGGHAEASARRLQLRVTTPLASTAIIHLLTSFQSRFDALRPGCQPEGAASRTEGSFATRYREPTPLLFFPIKCPAREKSVRRRGYDGRGWRKVRERKRSFSRSGKCGPRGQLIGRGGALTRVDRFRIAQSIGCLRRRSCSAGRRPQVGSSSFR